MKYKVFAYCVTAKTYNSKSFLSELMQRTGIRQENRQKQSRETEQLTRFIIEGGEANEHLDVDFSTAVDKQPEVLGRQVLQGVLRKYIQQTLPHCLRETRTHAIISANTHFDD